MPADLVPGPSGDALELANTTKGTIAELQAYEQASDEIRLVQEIAEARWGEGRAEGETAGFVTAKGKQARNEVDGEVYLSLKGVCN